MKRNFPTRLGSARSPVLCYAFLCCTLLASRVVGDPVDHASISSAADSGNWLTNGLTYDEQRFSPLQQINDTNAAQLGLAWYFDTDYNRGLEATPLVFDGTIYATGAWSVVYALDALTGELLWRYDPQVPKAWGANACCDVVNRGLGAWGDALFLGTLDGRLVSLDGRTGKVNWETLTIDPGKPYTITGAPRVVKGKVIIGNGGADFGVRGYVSAYDAATGTLDWRFFTVPGDPKAEFEHPILAEAAKTWSGQWWRYGGGGTVYDSISYDPELDLLYIGVGNGGPFNPDMRSPGGGDNLFLSSIVALKPDTGDYVWHYQTTPGDAWDYTATQHMILADIEWQGALRKVLMQAPKNGFFFVLDRITGELLSAEPFVKVNWASHYDMGTGRPVINPEAKYWEKGSGRTSPGPIGAHNWQPMAFNPATGLVYIPALDNSLTYIAQKKDEFVYGVPGVMPMGLEFETTPDVELPLFSALMRYSLGGRLIAWDPVAAAPRWSIEQPLTWNGGVLTTAGNLVFQGTADGRFVAYTADTGKEVWSYRALSSIMAPPVTYTVNGEQYITVLTGWGGALGLPTSAGLPTRTRPERGRVLTFKLNGAATLPQLPSATPLQENAGWATFDASKVERGKHLFNFYCARCHGSRVVSSGDIPDLRYMHEGMHAAFENVVLQGALANRGMIGFGESLNSVDAQAIRHYVIYEAKQELAVQQQSTWWAKIKQFFYELLGKLIRLAM